MVSFHISEHFGGEKMKASAYISGTARQFPYWFPHGTLGHPFLEKIDHT